MKNSEENMEKPTNGAGKYTQNARKSLNGTEKTRENAEKY